jgi:hypothetical protein
MERHLTRIKKTLQRFAVNQAIPAGRREVTIALNFISERTAVLPPLWSVNFVNTST